MASEELFQELRKKINHLRQKGQRVSFFEGFLLFMTASFIAVLMAGLVEVFFVESVAGRWIVVLFLVAALVTAFALLVAPSLARWLHLWPPVSDHELAVRVGRRFPDVKDRLANAIQLFEASASDRAGYSDALVRGALETVYETTRQLDFTLAVGYDRVRKSARYALAGLFVFASVFAVFPDSMSLAYARLLNPNRIIEEKAPFTWIIEPGNGEYLQGERIRLHVVLMPGLDRFHRPDRLLLFTQPEGVETYREEEIKADSGGAFVMTMENTRQSFTYYFQAEERSGGRKRLWKSPDHTIKIRRRPAVKRLELHVDHPAYARLGGRDMEENTGDVSALRGSRLSLKIESTKPLTEARIRLSDGTPVVMDLGTFSKTKAEGALTLTRSGTYHFELRDDEGIDSDNPVEYQLQVTADEHPFVHIAEPAGDIDIDERMTIHITGDVQDDFGLTRLTLNHRLEKTSGLSKPSETFTATDISFLLDRNVPAQSVYYTWNLENLGLHPEDEIAYYLEVFDNDGVSGPKSSKSEIRRLRFPSLEEILAEVNKQQDAQIDKMEDMSKQSDDMAKALDDIHREMLKDKKLDWKDQEELKQLAEKQEKMQEELRAMKENLQQMTEKMEQNNILSKETLEQYQELQKLMGELDNKEFNEAMQKLQEAMKNLDQNQMKDAVRKFKFDQESFKKNVERTLELFKRIKAEQMFDQMVKQADELARRQDALNEMSQKNPSESERQALAKEQENIRQSLDALQKKADDLKSLLSEIDKDAQTPDLDSANQMMKDGGMQSDMNQSAGDLQKGSQKSQSGQQNQQKIGNDLKTLRDKLADARKKNRQRQDAQVMEAMRKIVFDLLVVSQTQESVMTDTRALNIASPTYRETTLSQSNVFNSMSRVTENLIELSNRTFFVTSELGKTFGRALGNMSESVKLLEERNPALSAGRQNTAMIAVNDAVKQLLRSMEKMQGGQSGTGMESLMEQLGQMAGKQGEINDGTMPLMGQGGNDGSMSMEQQQQLGRMLGQQRALKEALDGMQSQLQGQENMKGRLGDMAGEMEEVIRDMERNNVNRQTIERQQKIFQRLLDASKSMHEKDYSEKRKSETGKDYQRRSPNQLPSGLTDRKNKLRQDYLKEKQQGFARDYEELIKKYFEALGNLETAESEK